MLWVADIEWERTVLPRQERREHRGHLQRSEESRPSEESQAKDKKWPMRSMLFEDELNGG